MRVRQVTGVAGQVPGRMISDCGVCYAAARRWVSPFCLAGNRTA
jgi:hypothetical protein